MMYLHHNRPECTGEWRFELNSLSEGVSRVHCPSCGISLRNPPEDLVKSAVHEVGYGQLLLGLTREGRAFL